MQINEERQRAATALHKAIEALTATTSIDTRLTALEQDMSWRARQQVALANTFFAVEQLGTIAAGEVWHIDAVVAASKKPSAAPTTRQGGSVRLLATVTRPSTGGAATVAYTATGDGGSLAGWGTGVRVAMSGNTVQIEGRVTVADTLELKWRRSFEVTVIA